MDWINDLCCLPDQTSIELAKARQAQLTKPPGALGTLEDIAIQLAGLQKCECPKITKIAISIFAADHGIAEEKVSAFPQAVTAQMVQNFLQGGAAISVLAKQLRANLEVIDVGIKTPIEHENLVTARIADGTANSAQSEAMTIKQLEQALLVGQAAINRAIESDADLFIAGEMGIANTTSTTALYCALADMTPEQITGAGTGLDADGIARKTKVIETILARHQNVNSPIEKLAAMGGFEIAALVGAYIYAAQRGIPVLVDGFISSVAAVYATHINQGVHPWLLLAHQSAEQGHRHVVKTLDLLPLLNLNMRLGEGSGAAVAVPLLQQACYLHEQMATFAEAAVAVKER